MTSIAEQSNLLEKAVPEYFSKIDRYKVIYRPYICPFTLLLNVLEDDDTIFDIGCGSGTFLFLANNRRKIKDYKGIEIDLDLVRKSKEILKNFEPENKVEVFNGSSIPNEIKNYKKIFLIDVLHHVPKAKQFEFLNDIFKKMDDDAKLFIKDINLASPLVIFNKMHDWVVSREVGNELSISELTNITNKIGFKLNNTIRQRMLWYPHFLVELEK